MNFVSCLFYSSVYIFLVPLIISLLKNVQESAILKYVSFLLIFNFITSLLETYLPVKSWFNLDSNLFLSFIGILFSIYFKYSIFKESLNLRQFQVIRFLVIISPLILLSLLIFVGYEFLSLNIFQIFESTLSIYLSFTYLINIYKNYYGDFLRKEPMFWISNAILILGIVNFIFNSFANSLYEYSPDTFQYLANFFMQIIFIACYLLIAVGFYLYKNEKL